MTAISMTAVVGFAALAIDVGMLYNVRTELQRTADAAALAGASKLLDQHALMGTPDPADDIAAAKLRAQEIALLNPVYNDNPQVDGNDIQVGYLSNPENLTEPISLANPAQYNTVRVTVRRDGTTNGPIQLLFAQIFGLTSANVTASAAAVFKDGVVGFKATSQTGNTGLMPLTLHRDAWEDLLAWAGSAGDNYSYDPDTGTVTPGSDGIPELNLYPGGGASQLPPGNFGTVDIGSPNNSAQDLSRQIRYGVSEEDLAYFGGELRLGPDGTLLLNGDTGLSAGIKDDLEAIKGKGRAIPLFSQVAGPGNNSMFTIIGFAGIRIMNVKLTGAANKKQVIIQPAYVIDDSVITEATSGPSFFVYQPVRLCR